MADVYFECKRNAYIAIITTPLEVFDGVQNKIQFSIMN